MADDRPVNDRLNGYKRFRPSTHQDAEIAVGLCFKLFPRGLVKETDPSGILYGRICEVSCACREREQQDESGFALAKPGHAPAGGRGFKERQYERGSDEQHEELGAESIF